MSNKKQKGLGADNVKNTAQSPKIPIKRKCCLFRDGGRGLRWNNGIAHGSAGADFDSRSNTAIDCD